MYVDPPSFVKRRILASSERFWPVLFTVAQQTLIVSHAARVTLLPGSVNLAEPKGSLLRPTDFSRPVKHDFVARYLEDRDNVVGLLLSHDLITIAANLTEGVS